VPDRSGIIGVIPARYGSTRFPGKPLAPIAGKPMIQHVYERALLATRLSDVVVATDDIRINKAVEAFGGKAVMTSTDNPTGTDRVAEVAAELGSGFYVNIQGDEPLIDPGHIDECARMLLDGHAMATLVTRIKRQEDMHDPNVVKVVVSRDGFAIYFSRALIPFARDSEQSRTSEFRFLRHVGIYGYTYETLMSLRDAGVCWLEEIESLEQLRALWLGIRIRTSEVEAVGPCVDVPEDIPRVEAIMASEGKV